MHYLVVESHIRTNENLPVSFQLPRFALISYYTNPVGYASLRVVMPTIHLHSNWDARRHSQLQLFDQIR